MTFAQVIGYETERAAEVDQLFDEWPRTAEGTRAAPHELRTTDRDKSDRYVDIVELPDYEQAMRNNDLPETRAVAERMRALCTGDPRFLNLEVLRDEQA